MYIYCWGITFQSHKNAKWVFSSCAIPEERSFIKLRLPLESICHPLRGMSGCRGSLHAVNAQTLSGNLMLYWFGGVYGADLAHSPSSPCSGTCAKPGNIKTNGKRLNLHPRQTFYLFLFAFFDSLSFYFFMFLFFIPNRIWQYVFPFFNYPYKTADIEMYRITAQVQLLITPFKSC